MKKNLPSILFTLAVFTATAAHSQTFSVVYNFGSHPFDPIGPIYSGIIAQGRDGSLYSTASGGSNNGGAAYKVTPAGAFTVLYDFGALGSDGYLPYSGLTLGSDGNLYGTTNEAGNGGYGTVFKMSPSGSLTTLYSFTDGTDGAASNAPPIQGTDGSFYGTTSGDLSQGTLGSIYKITSAGTFTALYQFDGTSGDVPRAPLVQGTDGNFYGTTEYNTTNGFGEIFKITPTGKLTVLYTFDNTHGAQPFGPLVQGNDGNFYGTTASGMVGNGGVFRMTPTGKLTVLHSMNGTTDGYAPFAGLVQATDGSFYGVNSVGGAVSTNCPNGCGTIFKLTVTPTVSFKVVYNFDLTTGTTPYTTLFQSTNGLLYGTTSSGGTGNGDPNCGQGNCGVFYSVNIGVAPFVSTLMTSGKVGAKIGFLGQGFSSSSSVTFGTVAATSVTLSGTKYLTATVPAGATTGPVTVTTTGGTLTSNKTFRVTPQLTSFAPPSGPVGTSVVITGVSLTQTLKVTFGGVAATTFSVNSDTQVTATVPTGAKTGKIVITTPGGTATSATNFTVTP